jgi:hypothetical protein
MTTPQTLTVRTFADRAEGLAHFMLRAGEAPRLVALDDAVGCAMENALPALEWSGAVGILQDDDQILAARLTADVAIAVIERRVEGARRWLYLGPTLDDPGAAASDFSVLIDEPGVRALAFPQRAHALAHFLRTTSGSGGLVALLARRAPETRHVRRWLAAILHELDAPRPMVAGWFAASAAGALFGGDGGEPTWRYIEAGLES